LDWSPDGDEIWFSAGALGEDPALYGVELSGKTRFITQTSAWIVLHDVSAEGLVLLGAINSRLSIRHYSSETRAETDLSWLDASCLYGLSDDGRSIVFAELSYGQGRNTAIYTRKTNGSDAIRLGFGNRPALSPDGEWVVCIRREEDGAELLLMPTGPGESRTLGRNSLSYETVEWFPDGRRILFTAGEPGQDVRTYVRDLEADEATAITENGVRATQVSPDGRLLLIADSNRLYVRPVAGGEGRSVCDLSEGESIIRWHLGGRHVFLATPPTDDRLVKVFRVNIASGRKEEWKDVPLPESGGHLFGPISLSADGSSYAYSFQRDLTNLFLVDGLR
jgi:Tol biopolymer transport system component